MKILNTNKYISEKLNVKPMTKTRMQGISSDAKDINVLRAKLENMSYAQLTQFMRSIGAFGENDFVEVFSYEHLANTIKEAMESGYFVNVHSLEKNRTKHIFVKIVKSPYINTCDIIGLEENLIDSLPFQFDKIIDDFPTAIAVINTISKVDEKLNIKPVTKDRLSDLSNDTTFQNELCDDLCDIARKNISKLEDAGAGMYNLWLSQSDLRIRKFDGMNDSILFQIYPHENSDYYGNMYLIGYSKPDSNGYSEEQVVFKFNELNTTEKRKVRDAVRKAILSLH